MLHADHHPLHARLDQGLQGGVVPVAVTRLKIEVGCSTTRTRARMRDRLNLGRQGALRGEMMGGGWMMCDWVAG